MNAMSAEMKKKRKNFLHKFVAAVREKNGNEGTATILGFRNNFELQTMMKRGKKTNN